MRAFPILFFLLISIYCHSQQRTEGQLSKQMDYGVDLMERGEYEAADREFKEVMKDMEALPSEMAYYFGRNSYHLNKYKQSINWLNKYIQLKGTKGRFYQSATKYLQLAEEEYLKISRSSSKSLSEELSSGDYDCGGLEKMLCPVCHGNGVIITKGDFDHIYKTCPYSAGESFLSCEEYNLFMRGLLDPKIKD